MNLDTICTLSNTQIESIIGKLEHELFKRKQEEKQNLIDNFIDAFQALKKANIIIKYDTYDNTINLVDKDDFYFD